MRGRIIFVNPQTKTGLIFGADRQRYDFVLNEWRESGPLRRNQEVNFQPQGNQALRIKLFSVDYADQPVSPESPVRAESPARATSSLETPKPADEPYFDDGIELPAGLEGEVPPLTASRITGASGIRGAGLSQRIFLDQGGAARMPSWKLYLIGIGAAFVFILVVYIITLFTHHH